MADKNNGSFVLFYDGYEFFSELPREEAGELIVAIYEYEMYGKIPEFNSSAVKMAFLHFRNIIDANRLKHEGKSEAGKKGGRPKKQTYSDESNETFEKAEESKQKQTKADESKEKLNINKKEDKVNKKDKERGENMQPNGCSPPPSKPARKKYGEYKHVKLTDEQHSKLIGEFGEEKTAEYIRRVDEYCQQCGKRYSDYNLTIRNWIRKDGEKNGSSTGNDSGTTDEDIGKYATVF